MGNRSSGVVLEAIDLHAWVVHDRLERFLGEQLVQACVVKRPVDAHDPPEKDAFDSLLLDEQLVEAEEAHDVGDEDLLRSVTLILEDDSLEELEQRVASLALDFFPVEVYFSLKGYLMEQKLTEGLFEPRRQVINFSYHLIVLPLPLIEIGRTAMLELGIDDELDEFLELSLGLLEDQFQVFFAESLSLNIAIFF